MNETSITDYITKTFPDVETTTNLGYTFFFYREERIHAFATIASSGNEYEQISRLDRPGVYRLNIGVSRETFKSLIGTNKINVSDYDFTPPASSRLFRAVFHLRAFTERGDL